MGKAKFNPFQYLREAAFKKTRANLIVIGKEIV